MICIFCEAQATMTVSQVPVCDECAGEHMNYHGERCDRCNEQIRGEGHFDGGAQVCDDCYGQRVCDGCGAEIKADAPTFSRHGFTYCANCA